MSAAGLIILSLAALGVILLFPRQVKAPIVPALSWRGTYDPLIYQEAVAAGIEPALLKAIVAKESSFDPTAINPEEGFTLAGRFYTAADSRGRAALREAILAGLDPATIGLNPSIGLAQVRVTTARDYLPGVSAHGLFVPATNLRAAVLHLRRLLGMFRLDQIDAYNVGEGNLKRGTRNLGYRDDVLRFRASFLDDFPEVG